MIHWGGAYNAGGSICWNSVPSTTRIIGSPSTAQGDRIYLHKLRAGLNQEQGHFTRSNWGRQSSGCRC